jgi:hypothetical protein
MAQKVFWMTDMMKLTRSTRGISDCLHPWKKRKMDKDEDEEEEERSSDESRHPWSKMKKEKVEKVARQPEFAPPPHLMKMKRDEVDEKVARQPEFAPPPHLMKMKMMKDKEEWSLKMKKEEGVIVEWHKQRAAQYLP